MTANADPLHTTGDQEGLNPASGQLSGLSPEDNQVVVSLYQTCPQLWQYFRNIIDFTDLVDQEIQNYEKLLENLRTIYHVFQLRSADMVTVARFVCAVGFIEQAAKLLRLAKGEYGTGFAADPYSFPCPNPKAACSHFLLNILHNFTDLDNQIRLRLARTGFLGDIVDCLKNIKHLSTEALVRSV